MTQTQPISNVCLHGCPEWSLWGGFAKSRNFSNQFYLILFWILCQVFKSNKYIPISLNSSAMSVSMVALSGLSAIGVSAFVTQVRNTWQGKSYDGQINSNTLRPPDLSCQFPSFSQDWLSDGEAALPTRLKPFFNVLLSIWENYFWIPLDHIATSEPLIMFIPYATIQAEPSPGSSEGAPCDSTDDCQQVLWRRNAKV